MAGSLCEGLGLEVSVSSRALAHVFRELEAEADVVSVRVCVCV